MHKHLYKIILLLFINYTYSQEITYKGFVQDSVQSPLPNANILAFPDSDDAETAFAITNEKGAYILRLQKGYTYQINISYIGYKKLVVTTTATEKTTKNFVLQEDVNTLDGVELTYKIPIEVKEDTTVYDTNAFTNGKERKLRETLKKLPGLDVDREGNVTSNGKKITNVLVDNKPFFTGNTKMAVNNIPANVVDQIEVIDNYSEIAMLKGLQDTDKMALNIKLKKDKKRFLFGDLDVAAGHKDRYAVHPNVFYYSPKTNINFIGDVNNTGEKAFTFSDYMEFEGGFSKILAGSGSMSSLFQSDFSQFLNNNDFKERSQKFGALNIRQAINNTTDISGYVIASKTDTDTENQTENIYQNNNDPFTENRTTTGNANNFFTIGKITLDYDPTYKEDFAFNTFVKLTNNNGLNTINTNSPTNTNSIRTANDIDALTLKQNVTYSRKLTDNHTGTLEATHSYTVDKPNTNWQTDKEILQGLIPLQADDVYNIQQTKEVKTHSVNAIVKDYWVLNNYNHLYFSLGVNSTFNSFVNEDVQLLSSGEINNFNTADFGNNLQHNFIDTYVGLEYKFRTGIFTFKPAVYQHYFNWSLHQLQTKTTNTKTVLTPEFTTEIKFKNGAKATFKYKANARFPSVNNLASNFILRNFNSVFRGNANLENEFFHTTSFNYSKRSLLRGLFYNLNVRYNKKTEQLKGETQLQGINQFNSLILFTQPEDSWVFSGNFNKRIKKIRAKYRGSYNYSNFYQLVNSETQKNTSGRFSNTVSLETVFKKGPNLEVGYTQTDSDYNTSVGKNKYRSTNFFTYLDYVFLENFTLKAEYNFDNYVNKDRNIDNTFDNAMVSLFYQQEDSPWGFEIKATNLFDTQFKQDNSFSTFLISDSKTFILPRIVLFKISYKL